MTTEAEKTAATEKMLNEMYNKANSMSSDLSYCEITPEERNQNLLKSHAVTEKLAHGLAYETYGHQEGQVIYIADSSGRVEEYKVAKLNSGEKGIVGEIYVPVNKNNAKVHVVFAGTHNIATAHADTEISPGEETFLRCKEQMMAQVGEVAAQVAKRSNKKVELDISGHSLGGALASLLTTEVLRCTAQTALKDNPLLLAEEEAKLGKQRVKTYGCAHKPVLAKEAENFSHLGGIKIRIKNPAGISQETSDYASTIGDALVKKGVNVAARVTFVEGDAVQQTGKSTIFENSQGGVHVSFMKVDSGQGGKNSPTKVAAGAAAGAAIGAAVAGPFGALAGAGVGAAVAPLNGLWGTAKAHTEDQFNENQETTCKNTLYTNQTREGRAAYKKEAKNKSKVVNSGAGSAITWMFNKLGNLMGLSGSTQTAEKTAEPEIAKGKSKACKA